MANLLQEVAGNHAVALWGRTDAGYATDPIMVERHLIFAATRIQIRMHNYPKWGDLVQIETWFQEEGRIAACRNWIIRNVTTQEEIGRATSTWVMLNTLTRRLAKMPDEMRSKMEYLAPHPPRDSLPASEIRKKIPDIVLPPEIEGPVQVARRSDMDMNGHINNVTYLGWALETVPADVYLNYSLLEVEIDYKSECMAGQTVESLGSHIEEDTNGTGIRRFVHLLRRCDESGCYELVRARTTWRPAYGKQQLMH
ncbi:g7161 [Coccomyxa viridis]|uniref:Acyl-[acyl-carrier-protein] hydrolase n=1 Tax=Coccomyxa viridis TaxID=1274662 RepID=A0ABP1FX53_9CHLO